MDLHTHGRGGLRRHLVVVVVVILVAAEPEKINGDRGGRTADSGEEVAKFNQHPLLSLGMRPESSAFLDFHVLSDSERLERGRRRRSYIHPGEMS